MRTLVTSLAAAAALILGPTLVSAQAEVPPDMVVQAALSAASDQLGVPTDNLIVVMSAQRDWGDSSLGCPQPGLAYAQIVTPGYIITIDSDDLGSEVQVHTDHGTRAVIC